MKTAILFSASLFLCVVLSGCGGGGTQQTTPPENGEPRGEQPLMAPEGTGQGQ